MAALRRGLKRIVTAILASIVAGLLILAGLIVFVLPGIYLAIRLSYLDIILANEDLGPIESIKRSFQLTKGNVLDVIGLLATVLIVAVVSELAFSALLVATTTLPDAATIVMIALFSIVFIVINILISAGLYFRYHQSALEKAEVLKKDSTSPLNIILLALAILAFVAFGFAVAAQESQRIDSQPQYDIDSSIPFNET